MENLIFCVILPKYNSIFKRKKDSMALFVWRGFNWLKAGATWSLLFTTKFPKIPGTHFIDLGRVKG